MHRVVLDGIRFFNSLLELPDDRLVKQIFRAGRTHPGNTWTKQIKEHLMRLGYENNWVEQSPVDLVDLDNKLTEESNSNWDVSMNKKPKLRTYRLFKETRGTAEHVLSNLPKSERSLITKLR